MIKMISLAKTEKYKTAEKPAPETSETEPKFADFAAMFSAPVNGSNNSVANSAGPMGEEASNEKTSELGAAELNSQTPLTVNLFTQDSISNASTEKMPLAPEKQINFKTLFAPEPNNQSSVLAAQAETIKAGIESGKVEILSNQELSQEWPKSFGEIQSVTKDEAGAKAKQPNSLFDLTPANNPDNSLEVTTQNVSTTADNGSALNLNQPKIDAPKAEKSFKAPEDFSAITFNKILDSASPEQKVKEAAATAPPVPSQAGDVYEQVQPKLLQLVALNKTENEKKVMKMRLHPAELGTVEIKLEKNASGKLIAHFQTESEATEKILNQSLDQLRDSLQNSGYQIERLEISCSPFSATGHNAGENQSRPSETVENQPSQKAASDINSETQDDLRSNESNRLLSVRA